MIYSGNVQGVGFRATTARLASHYSVAGTVKNLTNGNVELQVEGESGEVDAFLRQVQETMKSYIHGVKGEEISATQNFQGFEIIS